MKKRYFWALQDTQDADGKQRLTRFRSDSERTAWIDSGMNGPAWGMPVIKRYAVDATHPEVRRFQKRIAAGEQITFPVEID